MVLRLDVVRIFLSSDSPQFGSYRQFRKPLIRPIELVESILALND